MEFVVHTTSGYDNKETIEINTLEELLQFVRECRENGAYWDEIVISQTHDHHREERPNKAGRMCWHGWSTYPAAKGPEFQIEIVDGYRE